MNVRFFIPALLAGMIPAAAAVIQTSAMCQAGPETQRGENGCHLHYQPPWDSPYYWSFADADAGAGADDSVRRQGYDYGATVTTSAIVYAHGFDGDCCFMSASSHSEASLTQWFTTPGPVRDGWIDLLIDGDGDWSNASTGAAGSVGPYRGGLWGPYVNGRFFFTLGQPFLLQLTSQSSAFGLGFNGGSASNVMAIFFRLYEADLSSTVHPVQLTVPEPASTGTLGILALVFVRLLRCK